ncbi:ribosome silencing factor [Legionella jordanis]|uniref:Ribosomal silencing factor RsfS n=1 Tax=Legionella jordanis TaxID=456 RepID=A0A0W0V7I5_9GAMM|nr:ribosome silencing factor [Legionella jordanis]KTD16092.1 Ribosomal silencing factor RsfS [Legionella jordanis]RMX04676.1 ribosome silencing factor [Legionella jordanis]RMX18385.1 ribosome silencing factor [Legionella jordanis]VEH12448.1 putative Iojap-related protein [Legionella jordanis]HAT8713959.1 ribosome silencing factor [Legionella jordanis]
MSEQPELLKQLLQSLDDNQASNIVVIDVRKQTSVTDYMVICSGRSSRHVKAIAELSVEQLKKTGLVPLSQTGLETGEWVLIDFGDFVLHVMQEEIRNFYNLEGLWQPIPNK